MFFGILSIYFILFSRSASDITLLLILLSDNTSLNPGPNHQHKLQCLNEWNIFKSRGLHFSDYRYQ